MNKKYQFLQNLLAKIIPQYTDLKIIISCNSSKFIQHSQIIAKQTDKKSIQIKTQIQRSKSRPKIQTQTTHKQQIKTGQLNNESNKNLKQYLSKKKRDSS